MPIAFYSENIHFILRNKKALRNWLLFIIKKYNKNIKNIDYIFCDNKYLYQINLDFLKQDAFTDIITFDYSEHGFLSADIFVSIDRVKDNALEYKIEFYEELRRVMIHGILHLAGFDDKTKIQRLKMRKAENECLEIWKSKFHVKHH